MREGFIGMQDFTTRPPVSLAPTPRRCRFFETGAPPPTKIDRRAAAHTMTPAPGSSGNHNNETDFGHNVEDLLIKSNSLFQSAITNGFRISSVIVTTKSARDEDRKLIAPLVWG